MARDPRLRAILLFGMPGAGKGTQGAILGQIPELIHLSTGDMMRRLNKQGPLGKEVLSYSSRGQLVPDELTVRIWERHIQILELQDQYVADRHILLLDGMPRTRNQAQLLDDTLDVQLIFHLTLQNQAQARERLKARALKDNRLDDANESVINRRFQVYEQETFPTLDFYHAKLQCHIDAERTPIEVLYDMVGRLRPLLSGG